MCLTDSCSGSHAPVSTFRQYVDCGFQLPLSDAPDIMGNIYRYRLMLASLIW
jgi:hypothetical protein